MNRSGRRMKTRDGTGQPPVFFKTSWCLRSTTQLARGRGKDSSSAGLDREVASPRRRRQTGDRVVRTARSSGSRDPARAGLLLVW